MTVISAPIPAPGGNQPYTILVVDDDPTMRMFAREALEGEGFLVIETENGTEAIDIFKEERVNLVLLDVMMPGIDGFATCSELRRQPDGQHVPILMVTGLNDVTSINKAYQVGATDFVTKPINYLILGNRVRYMLRAQQALQELRRSEERLANAQRLARLAHWEWDGVSGAMYASEGVVDLFALKDAELPRNIVRLKRSDNLHGSTTARSLKELLDANESAGYGVATSRPTDLFNWVHPEDRQRIADLCTDSIHVSQAISVEFRIQRNDGEWIVQVEAEPLLDAAGVGSGYIGTIQDITERRSVERQIFHLENFNPVTGLPNRQMLMRQFAEVMPQLESSHSSLAVLSIDLDNFTRVNDTMGRAIGDRTLCVVAQRLAESLLPKDSTAFGRFRFPPLPEAVKIENPIAHLGSDEFVVLLPNIGAPEEATQLANQILSGLAAPIDGSHLNIVASASIGIALYPQDGQDAETLLGYADVAMHNAKAAGRNNFQYFSPAMNRIAYERVDMEVLLRSAVEAGEIHICYQPRVDLRDGAITGGEALVRWTSAKYGAVPPSKFIPLAEESGLIVPLGRWILETACKQIKRWQLEGLPPVRISVNLSARQLREKNFIREIEAVLKDTQLDPDYLEVELTEGVLMEDVQGCRLFLNGVKELGIHVALDDFGTGYSSLSYLKSFPIDTLKIDQSFVRDLKPEGESASIIDAIIALSRSLRMTVVAEGVETAEQLSMLQALGCEHAQGYYLSRPVDFQSFGTLLRTWAPQTFLAPKPRALVN